MTWIVMDLNLWALYMEDVNRLWKTNNTSLYMVIFVLKTPPKEILKRIKTFGVNNMISRKYFWYLRKELFVYSIGIGGNFFFMLITNMVMCYYFEQEKTHVILSISVAIRVWNNRNAGICGMKWMLNVTKTTPLRQSSRLLTFYVYYKSDAKSIFSISIRK